jgi:hypothetical protein
MNMQNLFGRAWQEFQKYYCSFPPHGGEKSGNNKIIQSERDACSYLRELLRRTLADSPDYTPHVEYPFPVVCPDTGKKTRKTFDLVIKKWNKTNPNADADGTPICFAEFKFLLAIKHEDYDLRAIRNDCRKLSNLPSDVLRVMCVVNKNDVSVEEKLRTWNMNLESKSFALVSNPLAHLAALVSLCPR